MRCKWYGYQYSEILRSLMCVYLCGGSCSEEIVGMVEAHCKHFYIRANRCSSLYDTYTDNHAYGRLFQTGFG